MKTMLRWRPLRSLCELRVTAVRTAVRTAVVGAKVRGAVVLGAMVLGAVVLGGCTEDALKAYSGGDAVCFWVRERNHSLYGATVEMLPVDTISVRITIMGYPRPYDRTVTGAAVEGVNTTAAPGEYRILGGLIPANATDGWFQVEVKNMDKLQTEQLSLNVVLTENEYFIPGLKENRNMALTWTCKLVQPQTWATMSSYICATYSTLVYRLIIQITGRTEIWYSATSGSNPNDPEGGWVSLVQVQLWGLEFGNYVRTYNAEHPDAPLLHDDGVAAGTPVIPRQ